MTPETQTLIGSIIGTGIMFCIIGYQLYTQRKQKHLMQELVIEVKNIKELMKK